MCCGSDPGVPRPVGTQKSAVWRGLTGFVRPASYAAGVINAPSDGVPHDFVAALSSLRGARLRPEVHLTEIPAPGRIAPYAVALTGELIAPGLGSDPRGTIRAGSEELADGRFIALYDPQWRVEWSGHFRIVSLVRATLEPEMGNDPLLAAVAWTWLTDCLSDHADPVTELQGTVTRVIDQSFGATEHHDDEVELEIRASWTPHGHDLSGDLSAWAHLLSATGGIPALPEGVTSLDSRRAESER